MKAPGRVAEGGGGGSRRSAAWVAAAIMLLLLGVWVWRPGGEQGPAGAPQDDEAARAGPPAEQVPGFDVEAPVAILVDAETGQVLYAKDPDAPMHPASLVKVMTLLVALDAVEQKFASLDDRVRASAHAEAMGGSQVYLSQGEVHTLEKLLRAIAIASANDASVAVAEHIAGTEAAFVRMMNRRARELGMTGTTFVNSHGLPPEAGQDPNLTTARDVATMSRELIRRHPVVLEWSSVRREVFRERPRFVLENTNRLIGTYEGADGLKTGFTQDAGYSLAATASRDGRRLIAVVMGASSDEARVLQAQRLLDLGFRAYRPVTVALEGEKVGTLRLRTGQPEAVAVRAAQTLRVLTLGGDTSGVSRRVEFRQGLAPPVKEGEAVGWVVALLHGQEVARAPVLSERAMGRASGLTAFGRWLRNLLGALVPGTGGLGTVLGLPKAPGPS